MGYTTISSLAHGIAAETLYFVPLDANLEIWQPTSPTSATPPSILSIFSAVEFCIGTRWTTQTNYQRNFNTGEVEVEDGVIYHKTEYRDAATTSPGLPAPQSCHLLREMATLKPLSLASTARRLPRTLSRLGQPAGRRPRPAADSLAHGWQPIGSHHVRLTLQPARRTRNMYALGYHENPVDQKFDPPGSQTINKRTVKPVIGRTLELGNVADAFDALGRAMGAAAGPAFGQDAR